MWKDASENTDATDREQAVRRREQGGRKRFGDTFRGSRDRSDAAVGIAAQNAPQDSTRIFCLSPSFSAIPQP